MGPAIGAGIGGLTGLVTHNQNKAEYNRQKELAAQLEKWSPWTGVHGQMPQSDPNMLDSILSGVQTGASYGAGMPGMSGMGQNPMSGAQAIGGSGSGMNQFSGGYEKSPWAKMQQPTFIG